MAFVSKRRLDWNAAARILQAHWKKTMEKRVLQADYQERRAELRGKAVAAQNAMIYWLNIYPELVLKMVGRILQKDPGGRSLLPSARRNGEIRSFLVIRTLLFSNSYPPSFLVTRTLLPF